MSDMEIVLYSIASVINQLADVEDKTSKEAIGQYLCDLSTVLKAMDDHDKLMKKFNDTMMFRFTEPREDNDAGKFWKDWAAANGAV